MSARTALRAVPDALADDGQVWFNTKQAAPYVGFHIDTVRRALEAGELHGQQRKAGGRWRIHRDCLDAWRSGERCTHAP